jgi:hypothetical protein
VHDRPYAGKPVKISENLKKSLEKWKNSENRVKLFKKQGNSENFFPAGIKPGGGAEPE